MTAPDFGFTREDKMLRDEVRKLLDARCRPEHVRATVARDHGVYERPLTGRLDETLETALVELGLPGMVVPEAHGGSGASMVALVAVLEELGAHACPSPLPASYAAAFVLRAAGASGPLARIAEGARFALALHDTHGRSAPRHVAVAATRDGDHLVLRGEAGFVEGGDVATAFVVPARLGDELVLVQLEASDGGLEVRRDAIVDLTRGQCRLACEGVRVGGDRILARGSAADAALASALPALLLLPTADLVGCAEWQLRTTVEYAKVREQFGRPIGSFQAVKHPLVDVMIGIDQARSLLYAAANAIDEGDGRAELLARMAKAKASDVGRFASGRSVQLHGGIGFTWECDVHLFFKRSEHAQSLLGDGAAQRKHVARLLID